MSRLFVLVLVIALPGVASAQRAALSQSYAGRGLTLPERTLRFDAGPYERGINDSGTILGPLGTGYGLRIQLDEDPGDDSSVAFGMGASYGILDTLEVGALLLPVSTYGDDDFGHVTPYVRWAFVSTDVFEMGLSGSFAIPTGEDFGMGIGMPINIRIDDVVRIEGGAELEIYFDTNEDDPNDDAFVHLDVPLALAIDIKRRGFIGPRVSFNFIDFDALIVPFGGFGGFTFQGRRGNGGDLTASFSYFFHDEDVVFAPDFELVFGGNFYFGL